MIMRLPTRRRDLVSSNNNAPEHTLSVMGARHRNSIRLTEVSAMSTYAVPVKPRHSVAVRVGAASIGGGAPVVVQSMTNTDTADVAATVQQVIELERAGSELVRITVNSD